jgi:hypothetical protein
MFVYLGLLVNRHYVVLGVWAAWMNYMTPVTTVFLASIEKLNCLLCTALPQSIARIENLSLIRYLLLLFIIKSI